MKRLLDMPPVHPAALDSGRRLRDFVISARRKLATIAICLLAVWVGYIAIFGANGMVAYDKKRGQYRQMQKELQEAQAENHALRGRVNELKTNPAAIEREARVNLHYAKPGETVFMVPTPPPVEKPVLNSAEKK